MSEPEDREDNITEPEEEAVADEDATPQGVRMTVEIDFPGALISEMQALLDKADADKMSSAGRVVVVPFDRIDMLTQTTYKGAQIEITGRGKKLRVHGHTAQPMTID